MEEGLSIELSEKQKTILELNSEFGSSIESFLFGINNIILNELVKIKKLELKQKNKKIDFYKKSIDISYNNLYNFLLNEIKNINDDEINISIKELSEGELGFFEILINLRLKVFKILDDIR